MKVKTFIFSSSVKILMKAPAWKKHSVDQNLAIDISSFEFKKPSTSTFLVFMPSSRVL
jgi:hypothetical protein